MNPEASSADGRRAKGPIQRALFIGPWDRGGISTINRQVVEVVRQSGSYDCRVLNTTPLRQGNKLAGYLLLYWLALAKILATRCQLVYLQVSQTGFFHQSIFLLLGKVCGRRTIAHFHAKPSVSQSVTAKNLRRIISSQRYIDDLIVLSQSTKEDLNAHGWKKNIHVVPNFVDAAAYPLLAAPMEERQYTVYLGRMDKRKGIFEILEVAAKVSEERFVFVGGFEDEATKRAFLAKAGTLPNVQWLGPIYDDKKIEVLQRARFLLFPSQTEVFPMTILECGLCGVIPMASNVGMMGDLIQSGATGFFINPADAAQMARLVRELLSDLARQQQISINCQRGIRAKYTRTIVAEHLLSILKNGAGTSPTALAYAN